MQTGSVLRASPVKVNAWHRQPPKSISLRGQDAQGSRIHSVPRKALKAGDSRQISISGRSRADQKVKPGIVAAAWQGSTHPEGVTLRDWRPQPFMQGFG